MCVHVVLGIHEKIFFSSLRQGGIHAGLELLILCLSIPRAGDACATMPGWKVNFQQNPEVLWCSDCTVEAQLMLFECCEHMWDWNLH